MQKVLIVGFDHEARDVIRNGCRTFAFEALTSETVKDGMQLAERQKPELIVIDTSRLGAGGSLLVARLCKLTPQSKLIVGLSPAATSVQKDEMRKKGATVLFSKPITKQTFKKVLESFTSHPKSLKVLLIDDEPGMAEELSYFFEHDSTTKWEFTSAMTGEEGLKKIKDVWPDLILLDLVLSHDETQKYYSGVEVFRAIKEKFFLPVVILASYPDAHEGALLTQMGVAAIISKDELIGGPKNIEHFLNTLKGMALSWSNAKSPSKAA